jgi:hypothetical protein
LSPWNNFVRLGSSVAYPQGEQLIQAFIERCVGMDAGKMFIVVCV